MKILIIDDNESLADSLRRFLEKTFSVAMAHTAKEGIYKAEVNNYDAIVLDLHLPDGTGDQVCKHLRKSGVDTPILILTATKETVTKIELLDAGADDFLTKPFQPAELRARLHALLRRGGTQYPALKTEIQGVVVDSNTRTVTCSGKVIELRRKEFDVLEYLFRNQGRVVTVEMIMDNVWEAGTDATPNTIAVHIKHLRDLIDKPFERTLIETVYGLGYIVR